jgi:hypothetical protein
MRSSSTEGTTSISARPGARRGSTPNSAPAAALKTRTRRPQSTVNAANGSASTSRSARSSSVATGAGASRCVDARRAFDARSAAYVPAMPASAPSEAAMRSAVGGSRRHSRNR